MNTNPLEEIVNPAETSSAEPVVETTEQDPLKEELERVSKKEPKTEMEKATHSLRGIADRIKDLGGDPASILGISKPEPVSESADDDTPVTLGVLRKMEQERSAKSALQLADEIENETERALTKHHLENTIRTSGNPVEDLKMARSLVNAVRNQQITQEAIRKTPAQTHSSSSSAPLNTQKVEPEITAEEMKFMRPPFSLSKEQIIAARPKQS